MKAILVERYGDQSVMQYKQDLEIPQVKDGQVIVKIMSAGVNPVYTYMVNGHLNKPLPFIPGGDFAGIVETVGEGVTNVKVGDRVWGSAITGAYAQYGVAVGKDLRILPENYPFEAGAGYYVPYGTALHSIIHFRKIKDGDVILVHGASGGVGIATLQLLREYQNITVIGTAGTEEGLSLILEHGAHHAFNHRNDDYMAEILKLTGNKGVDIIMEMLANVNLGHDLEILARYGKVLIIGSRGTVSINPRDLMSRRASVEGVAFGQVTTEEKEEIMSILQQKLESGEISPIISQSYPLESAPQAHHDIIFPPSGATGKITISPWE